MLGGLRCVVIHVKCDPNRLRGYGAAGVENGPFLLLWPVAYTTACTTVHHHHHVRLLQEAQLMLTTGSTRLAVSRGQQTRYHST